MRGRSWNHMFTGIIKAVADVQKSEKNHGSLFLTLSVPKGWKMKTGESIAVNGVCLTVLGAKRETWQAELMPETMKKSSFGKCVPPRVNLERSLKLSDRLDGHFVMGHVDATGTITAKKRQGRSAMFTIRYPKQFAKLVAPKGAIAIDGVSLTIVNASRSRVRRGSRLSVALVDYTLKNTTLGEKKSGDLVNLEFDVIAKYYNNVQLRIKN